MEKNKSKKKRNPQNPCKLINRRKRRNQERAIAEEKYRYDKEIQSTRIFPEWFRRVFKLYGFDGHVDSEAFDEDISELDEPLPEPKLDDEEEKEEEENSDDHEYYYEQKSDWGNDSKAAHYISMQRARHDRKRELRRERIERQDMAARCIRNEKEKETVVRTAYAGCKKARRIAQRERRIVVLDSIEGRKFALFSSCYTEIWSSNIWDRGPNWVSFSSVDSSKRILVSRRTKGKGKYEKGPLVQGRLQLGRHLYHVSPFPLPSRASTKIFKAKCGKFNVQFEFFGNGYIKLRIPREIIMDGLDKKPNLPVDLEFSGIRCLKTVKEVLAQMRPSSPRESFFERTHFMGSWGGF
ncbi:hypothetical protein HYFRA_00011402 [Hymenoscyphus fraxineus]|uniref:Uncharacterized protein n=1 Tax=Hymenoscyphus fraxineus TaxID=746836 RepID=A0A9N9L2I6_9HELO|nr:hypothetical protein HYFRA_00011402 [Hymenoscyphus fraxineus]